MCDCASCEYTDNFSGLPDLFREVPAQMVKREHANGRRVLGFNAWPRGNAAGVRASAKAYADHVKHGKAIDGEKLPDYYRIVPRGAVYPRNAGGSSASDVFIPKDHFNSRTKEWTPAPGDMQGYIAEFDRLNGLKKQEPVKAPARPAKPAKAARHLPELDRQREPAVIYAMPKSKPVKRGRGRPAIPGRFVVVKLEERLIAKAEKIGGKVTAGIREALERVKTG